MAARGQQGAAVAAYLEALASRALLLGQSEDQQRVVQQLSAAAMRWAAAHPGAGAQSAASGGGALAAESCGAVVAALRLLHASGDQGAVLQLRRCAACTCAFLALACTVRAFEEARDLPVFGQPALISGLQSAAGQQLNGSTGTVVSFDAVSGRFIVRLKEEDQPREWKKIRAQNLACVATSASRLAASGAQECGRACLEAVADIFDDLLGEMQDVDDEGGGPMLHSELATAMWEALVCCTGDGGLALRGEGLLEICGGDAGLCALLTRHVLAAHLTLHMRCLGSGGSTQEEAAQISRTRGLQERMARAYGGLFQPSALWRGGAQGTATDMPMAQLQDELDAHVCAMAAPGIHAGVLEALADAADFHLSLALAAGPTASAPPLALPAMLFQLSCAMLGAAGSRGAASGSMLKRHVLLLVPEMAKVAFSLVELVVARLDAGTVGAASGLAAARAALDAMAAWNANGLWDVGAEVSEQFRAIASRLFACGAAAADPAILARLALVFVRAAPDEKLVAAYSALGQPARATFWQQVGARSKLCQLAPLEARGLVGAWLGEEEEGALPSPPPDPSNPWSIPDIDQMIEQCLQELPSSLRELPPAPSAVAAAEEAAAAAVAAGAPQRASLGALDLPQLPGRQADRQGEGAQRRVQRLSRAETAKIRGVDPAKAPEELRCAIDGKLLGTPVRSPYGHLFELETLEQWLGMCGSVCPITGKPLRRQDCAEDKVVERKVVEWVKAAKAEHRRRAQQRRAMRQQQENQGEVS